MPDRILQGLFESALNKMKSLCFFGIQDLSTYPLSNMCGILSVDAWAIYFVLHRLWMSFDTKYRWHGMKYPR
ncbi:hypothetical protein BDFB_009277, partial [Asbolus verrucosus]